MLKDFANYLFPTESNNYHPPALNFRVLVGIGIFLFLLRAFLGVIPAESAAVESQTLMELINSERSQRNLTTLITHQALLTAAGQKSQDMIDRDYFAHLDPDGNYVWPKIVAAGYTPYKLLGENLAIDFSTSEGMVKAWIDSPTHRDNLLHPEFVHQGLAALYGDYNGRYTNLTTSLFGAQQEQTTAPAEVKSEPAKSEPPPPSEKPLPTDETETEPTASSESDDSNPATSTPPTSSSAESPQPKSTASLSGPDLIRIVFIVFGVGFLAVLAVDSFIIYKRDIKIARGHPSYHFFIFALLVLVFTLVWFWR